MATNFDSSKYDEEEEEEERGGKKEAKKMGNIGSRRRKRRHQQEINIYNYIATHPGYYPDIFLPRYHHHYPPFFSPYFNHHQTPIIKNDANIRKDTLRMEPDVFNPYRFLLTFTLDATAPGW